MKIMTCSTYGEALAVNLMLEGEGFHPAPVDRSSPLWIAYGADLFFYVEVPESEALSARDLLDRQGYGHQLL